MNEQMNKYEVRWQTQIGIGSTFYQGKETVWAENEDAAAEKAQWNVHWNGFRDYTPSHIVIKGVTRKF